jgi:predicted regulator of Ras-like GTPase activity (Roadblock/LC7/MglB family)
MSEPATTTAPSNLRFRQRPVEKIRLRLADLASAVPEDHLLSELPSDDFIEIDAHTALSHIVPKISLSDLARERPDLFLPGEDFIKLPAQRIATAYRVREESYDLGSKFSPDQKPANSLGENLLEASQNLDRLGKTKSSPEVLPIEAEEISETLPELPTQDLPLPEPPPLPAVDQPQRLIELIQSLPTFHRFSPAAPVSTIIEPLVLETENPGTDIPEQDSLQALFLTDEKLTVRRVVELCGDLPGIRSCVLTRDDTVIASHNVPENLDLVAMSSTASKMLAAMQDSSSQLGIGAVPALTLHTERGPLSIVQNNRLTMLVVHADRGFIPGVREKLTATLGELSRAPLALPSAAAPLGGMPLPPASGSI